MRKSLLAFVAVSALALSGCAVEPEPVEDQVVEVIVEEETVELEVPRHPLTGFEIQSSEVSGPSIAMKPIPCG